MKSGFFELVRYGLVGVVNTIVGLGLTLLLTFVGVLPEAANFIGWCVGVAVSFLLNSRFTFKTQPTWQGYFRFLLSMSAAFFLNLVAFWLAFRLFGVDVYLSQLLAAVVYTLSGFLLSKFFAFR